MGPSGYIQRSMGVSQDEWFVGFAYKFNAMANRTICQWMDSAGNTQIELRQTINGALTITRNGAVLGAAADNTIVPGVYFHFQWRVKISDVAGSSAVRLNCSVIDLLAVAGDTKATAVFGALSLRFSGDSFDSVCDVVVNDTQGAVNNSWPGDVRIDAITPNGAGFNNGWLPSAGTRFDCVNELPANTSDYIESSTPGEICTMSAPAFPGGAVQAVQHVIYGQKTDAGARQVAPVFRDGGVDRIGAAVNLADSYQFLVQIYESDPATGAPWAQGQVTEPGVQLVA
jgi:hypothetical protein